jgi:hypothetical protein
MAVKSFITLATVTFAELLAIILRSFLSWVVFTKQSELKKYSA